MSTCGVMPVTFCVDTVCSHSCICVWVDSMRFIVMTQVQQLLLLQAQPAAARDPDRLRRLEHPQDPVAAAAAVVELRRPLPAAPQAALVRVYVLLIGLSSRTSKPQHSLTC